MEFHLSSHFSTLILLTPHQDLRYTKKQSYNLRESAVIQSQIGSQ